MDQPRCTLVMEHNTSLKIMVQPLVQASLQSYNLKQSIKNLIAKS
jgi:hypothetical protein